MGIVVCIAHLAFDGADMTAQTSVGTTDESARIGQSLVLESLLSEVLLGGRGAVPFCPVLAENIPDFTICSVGGSFVIGG
jgi:hypothetical protein